MGVWTLDSGLLLFLHITLHGTKRPDADIQKFIGVSYSKVIDYIVYTWPMQLNVICAVILFSIVRTSS